jgi:hypothetical protein
MGGSCIVELLPGIDISILFIGSAVLIIVVIAAALYIRKVRKLRSARDRARRQRLDYQPSVKHMPVVAPLPTPRPVQKPWRVSFSERRDITENSQSFQQNLLILARKYSLDSFTIATSDGLVFASSGGTTAQEDAASYSRRIFPDTGNAPRGITLFSLIYQQSELTGIIRARDVVSEETKEHIKKDAEDILNRWI